MRKPDNNRLKQVFDSFGVRVPKNPSPEEDLIRFGGLNVPGLIAKISGIYAGLFGRFGSGGAETIESAARKVELGVSAATFGIGTVTAVSAKLLADELQYVRIPAYESALQVVGDYTRVFVGAALEAERIKFEWGQYAANAFLALYGIGRTSLWATRLLRGGRAAAQAVSATRALRMFSLPGIATLVAESILVGIAYNLIRRWAERRATNYAIERALSQAATQIFSPNRLLELLEATRVVLPGASPEQLFLSLRELRSARIDELPPLERFGYDYGQMGRLATTVAINVDAGNILDASRQIGALAGSFGLTDPSTIIPIFSKISRAGYNREIALMREAFEDFFLALSGDGKLQHARLSLVQELATFLQEYSAETKLIPGAGEQVARLARFFDQHINNARVSTVIMQETVRSLDDAMQSAFRYQNPGFFRFLTQAGITPYEALTGITNTPEVLIKIARQLNKDFGITENSWVDGEPGRLRNDRTMFNLILTLRNIYQLNEDSIMTLLMVADAVSRGAALEEIDAIRRQAPLLTRLHQTARVNPLGDFLSYYGEQSMLMSEQTARVVDAMLDMFSSIAELFSFLIPNIHEQVGKIVETLETYPELSAPTPPPSAPEAAPGGRSYIYRTLDLPAFNIDVEIAGSGWEQVAFHDPSLSEEANKLIRFLIAEGRRLRSQGRPVNVAVLVAQALHESGYRISDLARDGRNLYGIKAFSNWTGPYIVMNTREGYGDTARMERARFRQYRTLRESVEDYANLMQASRYRAIGEFIDDYERVVNHIVRAGYATENPEVYINALLRIIRRHRLYQYATGGPVLPANAKVSGYNKHATRKSSAGKGLSRETHVHIDLEADYTDIFGMANAIQKALAS